jgi:hypothetical protein
VNNAPDVTDPDLEEARVLQRKLRTVFSSKQAFAEDSARAVTLICDQALLTIADEYCQEMFCEVESYAQMLLKTGRRNPATIRIVLDAIQHRLGSLQMPGRTSDRIARAEVVLAKF